MSLVRSRAALDNFKHIMKATGDKEPAFDVKAHRKRFDGIVSEFEKAVFMLENMAPISTMQNMVTVYHEIKSMSSRGLDKTRPPSSLNIEIPGIGTSGYFEAYTTNKSVLESYSKNSVREWLIPGIEYLQEYLEEYEREVFGKETNDQEQS